MSEDDKDVDDRSWIPDSALEGLKMEKQVLGDKISDIEFTRKLFRESAPLAAAAIVHLAVHSQNERIRFTSAQYVVERVLGKPGEENPHGRTPLEALMEGVIGFDEAPAEASKE
jgi:hypothetical protein